MKSILDDGSQFMKDFAKMSKELNERQQARQDVEVLFAELNSYLSQVNEETYGNELKNDRMYLDKISIIAHSIDNLKSVREYVECSSTLKNRIMFWRKRLNVQSDQKEINGLVYAGIWMDDHMTGVFDCYDTAGVHLFTAEYVDGVKNGKQTSFYPDGKKKSICNYTNGNLNGVYIGLYETGQKSRYCTFVNGVRDGYYQEYFSNGQLKQEGLIKDRKNVFINLFFMNGSIYRQHLFDTKGIMRKAYEFDRMGNLVYEGNLPNGKYDGKSIIFYRNKYYANCFFKDGEMVKNGHVIPASAYSLETLDRDMSNIGGLDEREISWKKIIPHEEMARGYHAYTLTYNNVTQEVMSNEFTVMEDKYRSEVPVLPDGSKEISDLQLARTLVTSSNFQDMRIKYYTLFGDLLCMTEKHYGNSSEVIRTDYYPCGIRGSESNNPKNLRVKLVRRYETDCGEESECEATLYWNNGAVKYKGTMKGKQWVKAEYYLNTGKKVRL